MHILRNAPTPRWIIFSIDTAVIALVALLVFAFPQEFFGGSHGMRQLSYVLIVGIYALANILTGCYKCIVRLSVPYDIFKVFWWVVLSSVCIWAVSYIHYLIAGRIIIGIIPVFLVGAMVLCLLTSMRIIVKYLYGQLRAVSADREPVIVLGSTINAISLARTLKDEAGGHFDPVCMLSLSKDAPKFGKLGGIPVEHFNPDRIEEIFNKYRAKTLIFLQTQLNLMRNGFADNFISHQITLKMLNQIEEFDLNEQTQSPNISAHVNAIKIEDLLCRPVIRNNNPLVRKQIEGSTVLITGAAGSIGSEIVRQVAAFQAGCIVLLDQAETPMHNMQLEMEATFPDGHFEYYVADVTNKARLAQVFRRFKPDIVYHAAAYKHMPMMERNPTEALLTNVMGTRNLADLSLQFGVKNS